MALNHLIWNVKRQTLYIFFLFSYFIQTPVCEMLVYKDLSPLFMQTSVMWPAECLGRTEKNLIQKVKAEFRECLCVRRWVDEKGKRKRKRPVVHVYCMYWLGEAGSKYSEVMNAVIGHKLTSSIIFWRQPDVRWPLLIFTHLWFTPFPASWDSLISAAPFWPGGIQVLTWSAVKNLLLYSLICFCIFLL